jgi:hypothetical protein
MKKIISRHEFCSLLSVTLSGLLAPIGVTVGDPARIEILTVLLVDVYKGAQGIIERYLPTF